MTHDNVLNIGARLRAARQRQKLSLRELASRADVSPSQLSQIENCKANPSVMTLYNVASALSVPITFFFSSPAPNGIRPQHAQAAASDRRPGDLHADAVEEADAPAPPDHSPVLCPGSRMAIELMGGVRWERLTRTDEDAIQFLEIHYQPGASSGPAMSQHLGREFGLVLEGELKLELGFEHYTLVAGDSIRFDSTTPHRLSNEGAVAVRAIWIILNRGT